MRTILVPLAEGFEEIEAIVPIDVWRRAGYHVTAAGLVQGPIRASKETLHLADALLYDVLHGDYDLIYLPGGRPGADHLANDVGLAKKLKEHASKEKWIAAICAAPLVLYKHDLLSNASFTCHPSVRDELNVSSVPDSPVVVDKPNKLITALGAGTAMELALQTVSILSNPAKSASLRNLMCVF